MYKRKIFAEENIYSVSEESKKIIRLQRESQDTKDALELLKKQLVVQEIRCVVLFHPNYGTPKMTVELWNLWGPKNSWKLYESNEDLSSLCETIYLDDYRF